VVDHGELGGVAVRVTTWNVHGAGRPDLAALARVVFDAGADVVALQEVRRSQAEQLADLLGISQWRWQFKHRPFGPMLGGLSEGLALLSRFPAVAESSAVLTPDVAMRSFRRRVVHDLVVTTGAGPMRVVNTHLSSDHDGDRANQTTRLVDFLGGSSAGVTIERTVLAGDLNTVDDDEVMGELTRAGLADAWTASRAHGEGSTNPADAPHQRIDHVLVGSRLAVASVDVPPGGTTWARLSDHLPVTVTIALG